MVKPIFGFSRRQLTARRYRRLFLSSTDPVGIPARFYLDESTVSAGVDMLSLC